MRLLIAAKHAPHGGSVGGVQSWSRTVADELIKRGHQAVTWGPEQPIPLGGFDLGIIANAQDTARAFEWCQKTINVCHGIIPAEKPGTNDLVAFTSEEVRDHWGGNGPIIRQPIDTEFWSPDSWGLKIYLARFSYRAGLSFVADLAAGLNSRYCHIRNETQEKAREILRQSVCVLATGRAALEAMACDVPVVLCDHRSSYQPPLMHTGTAATAMIRNYSARGGITPTESNVRLEIEKAIERGSMRDHVLKFHDVKNIVDQLLGVAQ